MIKLAVLISDKGTGTNLQAIIDAINSKKLNAKIIGVISDTQLALGLKRAKIYRLPIYISPKKENLLTVLKKINSDYIVLAGWKQIILNEVIDAYPLGILNLHPGLIPDKINSQVKNPDGTKSLWNKGLLTEKAIQNFLETKSTYAGSSIHFLTHEFDFGPVLGRCFEKVKQNDTIESLYTRLKIKENQLYVEVLQKLSLSTVLVTDGGGRGAVLVEKYSQSPHVAKVLAAPGNDLMLKNPKVEIFPEVKTTDTEKIKSICKQYNVNLVDVAQDNAVAVGLTNALQKEKINVFGPTKESGQIEWDKAWARNFMTKFNIPSPKFKICNSQKMGIDFLDGQKDAKWYVKASGLAAGKGAIFAKNNKEAKLAISQMKQFGKSGATYLLEECLEGEEFSSFALLDGNNYLLLGDAQDHKKINDGDVGPNTGGMGSSSPPLVITPKIKKQINDIFKKTANGLVKQKRSYRGILYLGGMIDKNGKVWVIEFNARWGDPEAQVVIPTIKNDFYELAKQTIEGQIKKIKIKKDNYYRIVVTAASKGYPQNYKAAIGKQILGLEKAQKANVTIYGAGVKKQNNKHFVSGGRLFYIMAKGKNVAQARKIAYNALSLVKIEGGNLHYRKDIGYRDMARANKDL